MTESVLFSVDKRGIATVCLNKPDMHNAFDDSLIAELTGLFNKVANDDNIRAMILAGSGRSFCAGADLNWMRRMASYTYDENVEDAKGLATMLRTLNELPKPTIARVQGAAYGGAIGLIACCDIAIASKLTKFCLSEVKLGLIPATISPYVIEAMGARVCRRYFATAEVFSARRARRLGLISEAVNEEELDTNVEQIVKGLLRNSPAAVAAAKKLVTDVKDHPANDALLEMTSISIAEIRGSEEGQEGLKAFLEKRKPNLIQE